LRVATLFLMQFRSVGSGVAWSAVKRSQPS
jgi:hypothetical protein